MFSESFDVKVVIRGNVALVLMSGEIDIRGADATRGALLAAQQASRDVLVDLSDVTFMDSTGINALVRACRRTPGGGSLRVTGVKSSIRKVFEITGLTGLLVQEAAADQEWHNWIERSLESHDGAN